MKAKAAVFVGSNKPFEIREYDVLPAPKGYGRSQLIASGICGTDLHIYRGKLEQDVPSIIGHEFVGTLDDCDEAEAASYGLKKGDAVIADIAVPCGKCLLCRTGDDANCVNFGVTNAGNPEDAPHFYGGYAEVNFTPLSNLIKIPEGLDPAMTATFACPGPTVFHSVALAERAQIDLKKAKSAVVQGLGPVGIFAVMYLKAIGIPNVYAISARKNPEREALLKQLGADEVFCLSEQGSDAIRERLQSENDGLGVDVCVEASGAPSAIPMGMNILRNRGVYLVPGQYSNSGGIEIQPQIITFKAVQILGSSQYSIPDVKAYLAFLCDHPELHDRIKKLGSRYKVEDVNLAFEDAAKPTNIKTMLVR